MKDYLPHLIAHRCGPDDYKNPYPENSLVAFENTAALLAEIDVIRLKSGEFVVFHDDALARLGRYNPDMAHTLTPARFGAMMHTPLTQLTWEEVSQVDVGVHCGLHYRGTRMPLLENFLDRLRVCRKTLVVELKPDVIDIITDFAKLILGYPELQKKLFFISFDYALITALKKSLPHFPHFLVQNKSNDIDDSIQKAVDAKLDGVDLEYSDKINQEVVKKIHSQGLKVIIWNYPNHDTAADAKKLLDDGVDFVNTDKPAVLLSRI